MVLTPHHRTIMRSRSLSPRPRAPYLWHEREAESADRKGWYRVDYGSSKPEEMWYLPSFKDRMNFLERSVERATSEPRTRATSVPPTTVAVRRSRALSVDPLVKYPLRWRTSPFYYYNYRWPYTTFYDRYWPSLGPYSGRIWRLPWYRYPSSPLTASTYWRDSSPYSSYMASTTITPERTEIMEERRSISPPPPSYRPSATTQLILNRVALGGGLHPRSYPPSRYVPRYYPSYLDYDYGYGGYYYPYHYPRASRYDYLEDLESSYLSTTTSYRPRALDLDTDYRDKTTSVTTTPKKIITTYKTYAPGMLHDHVENMRHRLKSLAYSLDPSGPVPEIVIPERSTTTTTITKKAAVPALPAPEDKKYSSSSSSGPRRQTFVEYPGGPPVWKRRALARFPHEDPEYVAAQCRVKAMPMDTQRDPVKEKEKLILKDRLSNRIHQFFNTTLNPEQFDKYLKTYREPAPQVKTMMPESSLRANKYSSTKWEEPDTVFGGPSDKKPYSKDVGHVRFDRTAIKAISDGTTEEAGEEKKERRKKKKSKERDAEATAEATTASVTAAAAADHSTSEADPVSAVSEGDAGAGEDEEKERKKLEKKKRKQEREAAAKAAMEAELAALAAAEAELARLEAESSKTDAGSAAPAEAAPAEAAPAEVKRTDESEEPATTQAEEARLGAQDDTEAPADATATTTDAADATPDADAAADAADAATPAEAGTDDTADAADAAPSTRFDEDLAE
ncbi:uncharacterized abhydrolase domain-containing protein DDB_G0269086-like isoform X16 [Portunus trituberculatus]|uniref:uncharacterized abhydrolase domain-containing protein DDB_G0269086-like isoform X16 n=1 Tax=Portunus trituberculatus TaxID=210409 RepID=UPI001E1CF77D|nr:uncharacterized abhydrolase domain-containing protein DDB_G0269086-like isoform X16 [Portunus trituberculatus]